MDSPKLDQDLPFLPPSTISSIQFLQSTSGTLRKAAHLISLSGKEIFYTKLAKVELPCRGLEDCYDDEA
jgi:hypothetical protein